MISPTRYEWVLMIAIACAFTGTGLLAGAFVVVVTDFDPVGDIVVLVVSVLCSIVFGGWTIGRLLGPRSHVR